MKNITIAQIGAGYWGKNLIKNLSDMGILRIICDAYSSKIDKIKAKNSRMTVTSDYDSALNDPDIDGIVITTPASTHYELVKQALKAGKHVMVEKPFTINYENAVELVDIAEK